MPVSPNTLNYFQGTGLLEWTPKGGAKRDLGNIVECELTPTVGTKREHKSSRNGSKKTDKVQYDDKSVTIRIVLDEITAENLGMMMMSDVDESTEGKVIRIMSKSIIEGALTFTGTNDVGNKVHGDFPNVSFGPTGSFSPISGDDWGQIEITGDLLATEYTDGTSDFGRMTIVDAEE
ncbi:hypothetical protein [Pseudaminobacter soli (ex Li et al. 2025)]|uniref:Phage tail protein n=1 Tax=Pseudaminobacter soli (ex Li et al. 2025) TaxID=1295366 RepID=A0A2P7RZZ6_9HYPH|nr:hypothetical protein [Mesorhizobium soli]PSJ55763.1 hypothetical protein C7I85_26085 [Mesorhizobium soli]